MLEKLWQKSLGLYVYKIKYTDSARRDLEEIRNYLLVDLCNPSAVANLKNSINRALDVLEENPFAYPACDDLHLKKKNLRKCVLNRYHFVYEVSEDDSTVTIYRFFHGLQNWTSYI